jgi:hypothetical protein
MAKTRVQAQHLKPGDIVGSGEEVSGVTLNSIDWPSNKVCVSLFRHNPTSAEGNVAKRNVLWGKYTMITVERGI